VKPAIRFKVPLGGHDEIFDAVFGEREFSMNEIEDFVLCVPARAKKNLASPCTKLGVVVDDIDMRITHVIRGADHHFEHAEASPVVPRIGCGAAGVCARPANSRRGQIAPVETARRDRRQHVPHGRIPAGSVSEFSRVARMVAGGDEEFIEQRT